MKACVWTLRHPALRTLGYRLLALSVMAAALGASAGCAPVKPYERAKLAHPTMAGTDKAGTGAGETHLHAISEGAVGGSGGTGSGCGCN